MFEESIMLGKLDTCMQISNTTKNNNSTMKTNTLFRHITIFYYLLIKKNLTYFYLFSTLSMEQHINL